MSACSAATLSCSHMDARKKKRCQQYQAAPFPARVSRYGLTGLREIKGRRKLRLFLNRRRVYQTHLV